MKGLLLILKQNIMSDSWLNHKGEIIAGFLNMCVLMYLIHQVNRNRKLIRDLAKATKKLAEKTLK